MEKKKTPQISYDKEVDVLWIRLKIDQEDSSEEIAPGILVEYNPYAEVIGIEFINASRYFKADILTNIGYLQ